MEAQLNENVQGRRDSRDKINVCCVSIAQAFTVKQVNDALWRSTFLPGSVEQWR